MKARFLLAFLLCTLPSLASAQVGINTNLWNWSPPAPHHHAVARIELNFKVELPDGTTTDVAPNATCVVYRILKDQPVGDGYLAEALTAAHVVSYPDDVDVMIKTYYRNGRKCKDCVVLRKDENLDLAVVRVWVPRDFQPCRIAAQSPVVGDRVEFVGYGGGSELTKPRCFRSQAAVATSSRRLYADCPLIPGDSGGAVFNDRGELVSIVSGGWFWFDGGVKRLSGRPIKTTWPARAGNVLQIVNSQGELKIGQEEAADRP